LIAFYPFALLPSVAKNMPSQRFKVVIHKQQHQNQFFEEVLAAAVSLRMMQIPAGEFLMGSPEGESDRRNSESPQHQVRVEPFFMGKYPVTQAQYQAVMGSNPSHFKGDNCPVEQVSWHDATEFCSRLSRQTEKLYRLPTEAEWEYACRAGTTTPFHFGETITTDLANYRGTDNPEYNWSGSYGDGPKGEYREATTPVDHFGIANGFGLSDMHGNVWEWCQDHWHESYMGAPSDGSAWNDSEASEDDPRVLRGGSWYYVPGNCRSAARTNDDAGGRNLNNGFRVVCVAPRT
jgi:formylglycine-generating enzyme required for sulfatase activity